MKKKLQIRIYSDGRIQAETQGIKGEKCTKYISLIEELTDAKTFESKRTSEYYEVEENAVIQQQIENIKIGQ